MAIQSMGGYNPISFSKTKTETLSLENLLEMTVAKLAQQSGKTVREYLNGYSLNALTEKINTYAPQSDKDINTIIFLTINHADNLIYKYNRDGQHITFEELMEIKRNNPSASIISVFTYALAKKNPKLQQFAESVFDQKQDIKCKAIDNPLLGASPLSRQIRFIDVKSLKPIEIYTQTNAEDAAELKYRQEQQEKQQEDTRKANQIKLANLQIAACTNQADESDIRRQEYRTNLLIRA